MPIFIQHNASGGQALGMAANVGDFATQQAIAQNQLQRSAMGLNQDQFRLNTDQFNLSALRGGVADRLNQSQFDESTRQYNTSLANQQDQFNRNFDQNRYQFDATLSNNQAQFDRNYGLNALNADRNYGLNRDQFDLTAQNQFFNQNRALNSDAFNQQFSYDQLAQRNPPIYGGSGGGSGGISSGGSGGISGGGSGGSGGISGGGSGIAGGLTTAENNQVRALEDAISGYAKQMSYLEEMVDGRPERLGRPVDPTDKASRDNARRRMEMPGGFREEYDEVKRRYNQAVNERDRLIGLSGNNDIAAPQEATAVQPVPVGGQQATQPWTIDTAMRATLPYWMGGDSYDVTGILGDPVARSAWDYQNRYNSTYEDFPVDQRAMNAPAPAAPTYQTPTVGETYTVDIGDGTSAVVRVDRVTPNWRGNGPEAQVTYIGTDPRIRDAIDQKFVPSNLLQDRFAVPQAQQGDYAPPDAPTPTMPPSVALEVAMQAGLTSVPIAGNPPRQMTYEEYSAIRNSLTGMGLPITVGTMRAIGDALGYLP